MERYIPNSQAVATCIRVLLRDHTYDTLNRLLAEIQEFNQTQVRPDPNLDKITVAYMGGIAGLYAAANQVLKYTDFFNLTLTLLAVGICCAINSARLLPECSLLRLACSETSALHLHECPRTYPDYRYYPGRVSGYRSVVSTIGIYTMAAIRDEVIGGRKSLQLSLPLCAEPAVPF